VVPQLKPSLSSKVRVEQLKSEEVNLFGQ